MFLQRDEYGLPRRRMVTKKICTFDIFLFLCFVLFATWPILIRWVGLR